MHCLKHACFSYKFKFQLKVGFLVFTAQVSLDSVEWPPFLTKLKTAQIPGGVLKFTESRSIFCTELKSTAKCSERDRRYAKVDRRASE